MEDPWAVLPSEASDPWAALPSEKKDGLLSRIGKGVKNAIDTTAKNTSAIVGGIASAVQDRAKDMGIDIPDKYIEPYNTFYNQQEQIIKDNQPSKATTIPEKVVDVVSGLAPYIATGPVGVAAILNNAAVDTALPSIEQGDSGLKTMAKTGTKLATTGATLGLPVGGIIKTLAGAGGAVALGETDRQVENALNDKEHQRPFTVEEGIITPIAMQLGFGTVAHLQEARAASKTIDSVATRMESGINVPQREINQAKLVSNVFLRKSKMQASQDRLNNAENRLDNSLGTPIINDSVKPEINNPEALPASTEMDTILPKSEGIDFGKEPSVWDALPSERVDSTTNVNDPNYTGIERMQQPDNSILRNPEELPSATDSAMQQNPATETQWSKEPSVHFDKKVFMLDPETGKTEARYVASSRPFADAERPDIPQGDRLFYNPETLPASTERDTVNPVKTLGVNEENRPSRVIESPSMENMPIGITEISRGQTITEPTGAQDGLESVPSPTPLRMDGTVIPAKPVEAVKNEPTKSIFPITESHRQSLQDIRNEVEQGKAGSRIVSQDEHGNLNGYAESSTFPDYFKNKGYTKKESLIAIDKALDGKPLTPKQLAMVEDLNKGRRQEIADYIKAERRQLVKEKIATDEIADSQSANDFFDSIIKENSNERGNQTGDNGNLGRNEAGRHSSPDERVQGRLETTDDAGGFKQTVGVEGDIKPPPTIGSVQKQGGKAVGTSALMDGFTPDPQITLLHAGVPGSQLVHDIKAWWDRKTTPLQKAPAISTPESKVISEFEKNRQANSVFGKLNWEKVKESIYKGALDTSGNIRNALNNMGPEGRNVVQRLDALAGQTAIVKDRMEGMEAIVRPMSLRERQAMAEVIALDRDLDIAKYRTGSGDNYKFIFDATPEALANVRRDYQQLHGLSNTEMATIERAASEYFNKMKEIPDVLLKEGLITPKQHAGLTQYKYSPKQFLEKIDPNSYGGSGFNVPDSGIKALKDGSDGYFNSNPMELMQEGLARTYARIARNKANRSLYDFMQNDPANGLASITRTSPKDVEIAMMKDGEKYTFFVKPEFAAEWKKSDPLLNQSVATSLQWLSGSKVVKALATGVNPAFALSNIPRDVLLVYLQANPKGYSTILPKAFAEMGHDFAVTAKDAFSRSGRFRDYLEEGGVREFLTDQGKFGDARALRTYLPDLHRAQKILGYINETSEIWTRLAYRERLIKNGMDAQQATDTAASYLDFSRGGSVTKMIDNVIPYTNAAIQGARSFGRAAKSDPKAMTEKLGQLTAAVAGIYAYNMLNPNAYQSVPDRDKEANFIITLPESFSYLDRNGDKKYPYLKISKEQSVRPIFAAAEMAFDKMIGKEPSIKQLGLALQDASPVSLTRLPPIVNSMQAYNANLNSFTQEPIWRGQEVKPYAEVTKNTPTGYRLAGEKLGISPERTKGAVNSLIPQSNTYVDAFGIALSHIIDKANGTDKQDLQLPIYETIKKYAGSRVLGAGNSSNAYQALKDAQIDANTISAEKSVLRNELASEFRNISNTGGDNNAVIDKIEAAYSQGKLTEHDLKIIEHKIIVPPIIQKFERLPAPQALDAFLKTNSSETRKQMATFLEEKMNRYAEKSPKEYEALSAKIDKAVRLMQDSK